MKKLNTLVLGSLFIALLVINSCDPMDDVYLTLAMDLKFNTEGAGSNIAITDTLCLSDFEDYKENKNEIEEIRYVTSAYITINATSGLQADSLKLVLYQEDGTPLFQYIIPIFVAADYLGNPLEIELSQQEISNINAYLTNPQEDKCFIGKLTARNVQPSSSLYFLESKLDFLTELKIKPW